MDLQKLKVGDKIRRILYPEVYEVEHMRYYHEYLATRVVVRRLTGLMTSEELWSDLELDRQQWEPVVDNPLEVM